MTENNKFVYLVEVDYDTRIEGNDMHSHNVLGVYEDKEQAIEQAMWNADSDLDTDDVRDNPEKYIDFKIESVSDSEQRLRDIETALAELGEIIGG